ncbi:putative disease resistance protein [Actinoplanes sp. SE50/110]|uniref:ATP-binding protein n=1 Tax=Actinoplanes sp. (strain ATCC 31044 / CBS 674.73 / SE50/110) TaxID=134676 RepID=UPI00023ECB03|nr:BTAD domain-containing putative transcriptional regulator [Actinoplanes sp. SE50/110]AEV83755.1 putative disease resistance protein [Actinoplanes sp. SE50/110]SLL99508.1 disease resistance protein [Actinoplanes sp. SE50/110]
MELTLLSRVAARGVPISGARLADLLALLAGDLAGGCGAGRLIGELWPDEQPEHPSKALQTLVSRARARLGPDVIRGTPTGYRLTLTPEQVDASAVLLRAADAERHARAGAHAAAVAAADAGLALFGGPEADGPLGALRAARATVRETLLRARALALGRLGQGYEELARIAVDRPRDEEILVDLLRVEAATQGPAAALIRYDTYRRQLRDELGTEPGPALRAAHRELLLSDAPVVRQGLRFEPNELLGREDDIAAVGALLRTARVVSIVGAGGLGKTRLAQAVGRRAGHRMIFVVELAGVTRDADVLPEVATALGVAEAPDPVAGTAPTLVPERASRSGAAPAFVPEQALLSGVAGALTPGPALLVLDNCEQVLDGVAGLVQALIARSGAVTVLTTSRAPLGIWSESVYPLAELDLDTTVELFTQRARAARPAADLPAGPVRELCRRLDGLPLAVELAAARIRVMSPAEIGHRLDDRFALLRDGSRDAPDRHRTLHAVIDWSWHLLDDEGRAAMRALSVFPGGFTAEAARQVLARPVSGKDADTARHVLGEDAGAVRHLLGADAVARLVEHSLVKVQDSPAGTRFVMLETVREFAFAQAGPADEAAFLAWARDLGVRDEPDLAAALVVGVDGFRADHDNLVRAHRSALAAGDAATVASTTALLGTLWVTDSNVNRLIALAAEAPGALVRFRPDPAQVETVRTAAVWCTAIAFLVSGSPSLRALAVLRRLPSPDPATLAGAAQTVICAPDLAALATGGTPVEGSSCSVVSGAGRDAGSGGSVAAGGRPPAAGGSPLVAGLANYALSYVAENANDPVAAVAAARAMLVCLQGEHPWLRAVAHGRIGELCLRTAPGEEAFRHLDAALSIMEELGASASAARARWAIVLADLQRGAFDRAEQGLEVLSRGVLDEEAGRMLFERCTRAEILLGRGDVDGGLALWREAARALRRTPGLWANEMVGVAVLVHCRHGRLDLVQDLAGELPGRLAALLPDVPVVSFRVCGVLLMALAEVRAARGEPDDGHRDLAERFGFSGTFQATVAVAGGTGPDLDHEAVRAAALALLRIPAEKR